jgi:pimeloyl-ACP methyl ester carboxylesterase
VSSFPVALGPDPANRSANQTSSSGTRIRAARGREDISFGNELAVSAARKLPDAVVRYYIDQIAADPEALRGSFELYRTLDTTVAQNEQRQARRLTMPVLAIGGEMSSGQAVGSAMKLVADDVQSVVLAGSGHWVAEEASDDLLAALTTFLAPYRDGAAQLHAASAFVR